MFWINIKRLVHKCFSFLTFKPKEIVCMQLIPQDLYSNNKNRLYKLKITS